MMTLNDVYVVKMFSGLFGIPMLNVFYYQEVDAGSGCDVGALELFEAFDAGVLVDWAGCVSENVLIDAVEVFAINAPTNFHSATPVNDQGTRAEISGERQATWNAFSFKSNRAGAGSRASAKRFSGLFEGDSNANVLSSAFTSLTPVIDLQDDLSDVLVVACGARFQPVQVKSGWVVGGTPVVNFNITNWLNPTMTTQVSRK